MQTSGLIRQPIFDKNFDVIFYELKLPPTEGQDISTVLDQALDDITLDKFLNQKPMILPVYYEQFAQDFKEILPPEHTIFEIVDYSKIKQPEIPKIDELKKLGYRLTIDLSELMDIDSSLLPLIDFIKLDYKQIQANLDLHAKYSENNSIIATEIDEYEKITQDTDKLYDYFQGGFINQPNMANQKDPCTNSMVILKLLSEIQRPDIEVHEIEKLIQQDISLSYALLRVINSAAFGVRRKVESLREAIVILGVKGIRNLASTLAMSGIENKPSELVRIASIRARMCELIAISNRFEQQNSYFTVGLFSTIEALFDTNLKELLSTLPLTDDIKIALMAHRGQMGETLRDVINFESGNWHLIDDRKVDMNKYQQAYTTSVAWSAKLIQ